MRVGEPVGSIRAVAALDDDLRARMYRYVRRAAGPVTREEAAEEVGISRKLAAFHLDKLVAVGMLRASTAAGPRSGRVGRAPKVYEVADIGFSVAIPARAHDVIGAILIDAITDRRGDETPEAARIRVARDHGSALAASAERTATRGRLGPERALTATERALDDFGYEPYRARPDRLRLRNCPFHPLTGRAPELVCAINQAFLDGFLSGLGAGCLDADLRPKPGECCVEIRPRPRSTS